MLHDKKEIDVHGNRTHNCRKPVFDMTAGRIYASGLDTCEAIGAYPADLSRHLHGKTKAIKGKKLCFVSETSDHIDEIADIIRTQQEIIDSQAEIIAKYEAIIAEQEERRKAKEALEARKAEYEAKRKALEEEALMLEALERELGDI